MLKVVFWGLVALDLAGIVLWLLLGLAAAGSSRTSPAQVTLLLFVLPCVLLAVAVVLFLRATTPLPRFVALLIAATPLVVLVAARALAELRFRAATSASGEMTFFRAGPLREIAEAIARNDAATVASLARTVDVNATGLDDMTLLMLAMRQLRVTPERHEVLRALLDAGADPNRGAQDELPLAVAIQVSGKAGAEPVKLLLDAGANPDLATSFGEPVFFAATGKSASLDALALLIDRGADVNAPGRNQSTALFSAANARNWEAALLLLRRGADLTRGRTLSAQSFAELIERESATQGGDTAFAAVRALVR